MDCDVSPCGLCEEATDKSELIKLKSEESEILEIRNKKMIYHLCKSHYSKEFKFYSLNQKFFCDPPNIHSGKAKGDREVSLEKFKEYKKILSIEVFPLKKLCSNCQKKLEQMIKDHLEQSKPDSQSSVDTGGLSQGSNFSVTSQGMQAEAEKQIETIDSLFEQLNLPPVDRERYLRDKKYEAYVDESVIKMLKFKFGKEVELQSHQEDLSTIMLTNIRENIQGDG